MDNKPLGKTIKPLLSNKFVGKYKIHFNENNEHVKTNKEIAET